MQRQLFACLGLTLEFTPDALRMVAVLASQERRGAAGLAIVLERVLRDFAYELPGTGISRVRLDSAAILNPTETVRRMLGKPHALADGGAQAELRAFAQRFEREQGHPLDLDDGACQILLEHSRRSGRTLAHVCEDTFACLGGLNHLAPPGANATPFAVTRDTLVDLASARIAWSAQLTTGGYSAD
jgi:hypothetical protein